MSRVAGYLEKMFRTINADSFNGELEEPIITIQSTPTAYGHVSVAKTWKRKGEDRHELNISADWLQRPIENVVATLIHEMVHLYNMQHDIQDCSRDILEKGWGDIDMGRGCLYGLFGGSGGNSGKDGNGGSGAVPGADTPKKGNSRRYKCPSCGALVRTTKDLHIICGKCSVDFELT